MKVNRSSVVTSWPLQLQPSVVTVTLPARSKRFSETLPEQWGQLSTPICSTLLSFGNSTVYQRKWPRKVDDLCSQMATFHSIHSFVELPKGMSSQNMNQSPESCSLLPPAIPNKKKGIPVRTSHDPGPGVFGA